MGQFRKKDLISTFSIAAFDPDEQAWGIAVQSKFLGVGAVVPYAKAGVGAVATQSLANPVYGSEGLELLAKGQSAEQTLQLLTEGDEDRDWRQAGVVDASGRPATFTGNHCYEWAGGITGNHYAAQGNILVGADTVNAMGTTFEQTSGPLAERLLQAIQAGQSAGGDSRGRQSAALLVVKDNGGYGGKTDRAVDLRVDDHATPIQELIRIYDLHQLYFSAPNEEDVVPIDDELKQTIIQNFERTGYLSREQRPYSDEVFKEALETFFHTENFEEREQPDGWIDRAVVRFLKNMSAKKK